MTTANNDYLSQNPQDFETYAAGKTIFRAGDVEAKMYAVVDGEVELILDSEVVESVVPGGFFGELSLIELAPRTSTARAKTEVRLLPLDKSKFMAHVQSNPEFALTVMKVLADRLRDMDSRFKSR